MARLQGNGCTFYPTVWEDLLPCCCRRSVDCVGLKQVICLTTEQQCSRRQGGVCAAVGLDNSQQVEAAVQALACTQNCVGAGQGWHYR